MGQLVEFINTHDPNTAKDELEKLIQERQIPKETMEGIFEQAKGIMKVLGLK